MPRQSQHPPCVPTKHTASHWCALPPRFRVLSGIAAILIVSFALVVLARAGSSAGLSASLLFSVRRLLIAGFLVRNTVGNLVSKSRIRTDRPSTLVGAVSTARAVDDEDLSREILASAAAELKAQLG
jgi:hypothetical protein